MTSHRKDNHATSRDTHDHRTDRDGHRKDNHRTDRDSHREDAHKKDDPRTDRDGHRAGNLLADGNQLARSQVVVDRPMATPVA